MADFLPLTEALILSRVHDAVLLLDEGRQIVTANERFFTWTSFATDQVVGRPIDEFWDDNVRWSDWLTVLRLAGAARDSELLDLKTRSGDSIPVEVHLAAVPDRARQPRLLLVLHDLRPLRLLEQLVHQDPLTGTASRAALLPRLEAELQRSARLGTPLGLVLLDVDAFARLNAQWGAAFGDEVLRVLGAELRDKVGAPRWAGRWGSDEFLVLLPRETADGAAEVAEGLGRSLASRLFLPEGREITVTASFGVTAAGPQGLDTASALLARAALALERARNRGPNQVEVSR